MKPDKPEKKRGALSTEEMNFIIDNLEGMSLAEIAEKLNRNVEPIAKYAATFNVESKKIEQDDDQLVKHRLLTEFFWPILKQQLSKDEQTYFVAQWLELVQQFNEDITPTEKQQIKALILNEIYKNRAGVELKKCFDDIEKYEKKINLEENKDKPDLTNIGLWNTQIAMAKTSIHGLTIQIKDYSKISQDLNRDLKGTREQRFIKVENNQTTFSSIIKALMEKEERERQGKEMALMTLATQKATENMYVLHEYIDRRMGPAYFKC